MRPVVALLALCGLLLAGCGTEGAPAGDTPSPAAGDSTPGDGGYDYASDVSSHRLAVADVCAINESLDAEPPDFAGVTETYRDGGNSVKPDGSVRTIEGFASNEDRNQQLQDYYGSPTPLDDHVAAALERSGPFAGESDAVRRQAVQKGIQNQIMVAWVIFELDGALARAEEGNFDPDKGVAHKIDEAWAFYHGAEPDCAPFATADKRAADFGTEGADGATARANEEILAAMIRGRDASLASDAAGVQAADSEIRRAIMVTYSQATLKYAQTMGEAVAAGDTAAAREQQAEGWAFWRTIEATAASSGADAAAVNGVLSLDNPPGEGGIETVRGALRPAWDTLGITDDDLGTLQG